MMSSERDNEEQKTLQHHAQLINELPRAVGSMGPNLYLYQYKGTWLFSEAILGAMLMQTHFKPQSIDIFLSSFPKCGTTWLRALMFTILNRASLDFSDHPLMRKGPHEMFPILDLYNVKDYPIPDEHSPRLFATHLAHTLLPSSITDPSSGCKFVYVCRDPKDTLVSLWHYMVKLRAKELPPLLLDQMFQMFCEGLVMYAPYWEHVLGYWEASLKSPEKILFFKYEEMKRDAEYHVKKLAEFMSVPISVEEEENETVKKIVEFCSFEHLTSLEVNKTGTQRVKGGYERQNKDFFRRGEVGDWKSHLTEEMKDRIDQITRDKFKGTGLTFGVTPI